MLVELETRLVEHVEQKVEDISADDILRVEVTGSLLAPGVRPKSHPKFPRGTASSSLPSPLPSRGLSRIGVWGQWGGVCA